MRLGGEGEKVRCSVFGVQGKKRGGMEGAAPSAPEEKRRQETAALQMKRHIPVEEWRALLCQRRKRRGGMEGGCFVGAGRKEAARDCRPPDETAHTG